MTGTFYVGIDSPIFDTSDHGLAQAHAAANGGDVYTWKTIESSNWLERGLARSDALALVVLPQGLPDTLDMPDDPSD